MAEILSESERRTQEKAKEQKRNKLKGQIHTFWSQISSYDNEISSLEFKLASQRTAKMLFDGKCSDLDTEKAAKSIGTGISAQYVQNLKFAFGYTQVMDDLLSGNTAVAYQNYREETGQFMQMEIEDNQIRLEELRAQRNSSVAAMAELNHQLKKI